MFTIKQNMWYTEYASKAAHEYLQLCTICYIYIYNHWLKITIILSIFNRMGSRHTF